MSNEKMREEFEAAVALAFHQAGNVADLRKVSGHYIEAVHQSAWWAWQASRAAVVVELPLIHRDNYANASGYNCAIEAVCMTAQRIEAAGLKVKP